MSGNDVKWNFSNLMSGDDIKHKHSGIATSDEIGWKIPGKKKEDDLKWGIPKSKLGMDGTGVSPVVKSTGDLKRKFSQVPKIEDDRKWMFPVSNESKWGVKTSLKMERCLLGKQELSLPEVLLEQVNIHVVIQHTLVFHNTNTKLSSLDLQGAHIENGESWWSSPEFI